eukprot:XP_011663879.1 PREDICTED: ribosomal RNA-processing protein 7 homolog A [Strongylocentrotus purpuratus]
MVAALKKEKFLDKKYKYDRKNDAICIVPVKFSEKSSAGHMLYYKEHSVKESEDTKPTDRTLFVVNVPPYCNEECLQRLFGGCGGMESVILQAKAGKELDAMLEEIYPIRKTRGFKIAYIVFKDDSSVVRAMKQKYKEPFILSPEGEPGGLVTGYRKWCSEYEARWEDPKQLQKKADDFMIEFDKRKHESRASGGRGALMTMAGSLSGGKQHSASRGKGRTESEEISKEGGRKKRRGKELDEFFIRFQSKRESKEKRTVEVVVYLGYMDQKFTDIAELRMKFEEDKQRITQMRAARKFKPY